MHLLEPHTLVKENFLIRDLNGRLKDMFQTKEEFEAMSKAMTEEIFGPEMKKAKKDDQQKFLELSG